MKRDSIGEVDLHAYVDGELSDARIGAVRAHLDSNPSDLARVEAWRRQNVAVRRAFEFAPHEGVSKFMERRSQEAIQAGTVGGTPRLDVIRAARRRRRAITTLAAFLGGSCVAMLGAIAISRVNVVPEQSLEALPLAPAAQARRARLAWRTYAREVDRSFDRPISDRSAVAAALQRATALPRVPDFSREKFELVTTRTMPGEAEPAAFLLYESPARVRVALIVERTPESDSGPLLSDDGGLRCLSWRAAGYAFAMVGPAESDTLRALARAAVIAFSGR